MRAIYVPTWLLLLSALWCGVLAAQPAEGTPWRLGAELDGFHLVVPEDASPTLKEAGKAFQRLWRVATRRTISISDCNEGRTNVWLGSGIIPPDLLEFEGPLDLLPEEFLVRTFTPKKRLSMQGAERHMFITGGTDRAVLHGVYAFFAREMGVTWLEPGLAYAPRPVSALYDIDFGGHPEFDVCQIGLLACWSNGTEEYGCAHGLSRGVLGGPGAVDYFDVYDAAAGLENPDENRILYGSEAGARRLVEEIKAAADSASKETPFLWKTERGSIWLLAAMTHLKPVLSEEGRALNEREGSPAAAILYTAGAVAEQLEETFPGDRHLVQVLLSPKMQEPPRRLRLHPNVIVQLSTANCDFARPLSDPASPANARFISLLEIWRQSGAHLYIYDHLVNARDPRLPFPCLENLQNNMLLYTQKGIDGVYFAGMPGGCAGGADLAALRLFLAARLLSDPDIDVGEARRVFFEGYYGPAAKTVENHTILLRDALMRTGMPLTITDDGGWISESVLEQARGALQEVLRQELPAEVRGRVEDVMASVSHVQASRGPGPHETAKTGGR